MHPGDQGIGGDRQLLASRQIEQGAIIANAQSHAFGRLRTGRGSEEVADKFKLAHSQQRRLALESLNFSFTQAWRQFDQNTVDEIVTVSGTEHFCKFDAFVDNNAVRHVNTLDQFPSGQAQNRQLNWV